MSKPTPVRYLGRGLHQDCMVNVDSLEQLAKNVIEFLMPQEKSELQVYLTEALHLKSPSELKGELNRCGGSLGFNSKSAAEFLRATMKALESTK